MEDDLISDPRDFGERVEAHRDRDIFEDILPSYERYRIDPGLPDLPSRPIGILEEPTADRLTSLDGGLRH